eukprot:556740-Rhodomonas_salina.1
MCPRMCPRTPQNAPECPRMPRQGGSQYKATAKSTSLPRYLPQDERTLSLTSTSSPLFWSAGLPQNAPERTKPVQVYPESCHTHCQMCHRTCAEADTHTHTEPPALLTPKSKVKPEISKAHGPAVSWDSEQGCPEIAKSATRPRNLSICLRNLPKSERMLLGHACVVLAGAICQSGTDSGLVLCQSDINPSLPTEFCQVLLATSLHMPYAKPGTDVVYRALAGTKPAYHGAIGLGACYAMPGTETAYGPTRS